METARTHVRDPRSSRKRLGRAKYGVWGMQPDLQDGACPPGWRGQDRRKAGAEPGGSNSGGEMAGTLSRGQTSVPRWRGGRRPELMGKVVIEGGVPLSGTVVPAGNKNGALPIHASTVLTADE